MVVWYYCDYCNKNVRYPEEFIPLCKECGFYLKRGKASDEEISQVQEERTVYCPRCAKMVYSVPIDLIIRKMEEKVSKDTKRLNQDKKRVKQEYRLKMSNWSYLFCTCIPILLVSMIFALMAYGPIAFLILIPIGILIYIDIQEKTKLKNKRLEIRDTMARKLDEDLTRSKNELLKAREHYQNICNECMNAVSPS